MGSCIILLQAFIDETVALASQYSLSNYLNRPILQYRFQQAERIVKLFAVYLSKQAFNGESLTVWIVLYL